MRCCCVAGLLLFLACCLMIVGVLFAGWGCLFAIYMWSVGIGCCWLFAVRGGCVLFVVGRCALFVDGWLLAAVARCLVFLV